MPEHTLESLEAMDDAELDALVAEVVMGWEAGEYNWYRDTGNNGIHPVSSWKPTQLWHHCGEVIGRLVAMGCSLYIGHGMVGGGEIRVRFSNKPTRAICIAAILMAEGESR